MGEHRAEPGAGPGETFSLDASLAGMVRELLDEGRDARIALAGNGELVLLPRAGRYVALVRDMAAFCLAPAEAFEIALIDAGSVEAAAAAGRDIDELLWHAGFHGSRGRLLEGLSDYDVVQFRRWPNLSRLPASPNAMRICALLVNHPTSIMMARRRLRVEAGEIHGIYSAAYLSGIANVLNRKSIDGAAEHAPPADAPETARTNVPAGSSNILGMLFSRISGL